MSDLEKEILYDVLKDTYRFDPIVKYGTGALSFRNVMIEFWTNGKIRVKNRLLLGNDVQSLLNAMTSINLIRSTAVKPLLEKFYMKLEIETNK